METKINIAEILKDKPKGIRLYSPIFGECAFCLVREETDDICVKKHNGEIVFFDSKGLYNTLGEVMLFPSREMRDWSKFAWKRGDVLISDCGFVCIFKEWASDDYTRFNGCYFDGMPNAETAKYSNLDNNTAYGYIRELENRCGGKLNLETLKIEKQTEFKDGDVVVTDAVPSLCYSKCIFILKGDLNTGESCANSYIFYNINNNVFCFDVLDTEIRDRNIHLATEEEKQHLFDALAKKGKTWDAGKKQIVDLKPKVELKPFDKVLIRDFESQAWQVSLFGYKDSDSYYCCNGCGWNQCIPYNEKTAHLLGTTGEWKGGEG